MTRPHAALALSQAAELEPEAIAKTESDHPSPAAPTIRFDYDAGCVNCRLFKLNSSAATRLFHDA
jgi:hypothetical protein